MFKKVKSAVCYVLMAYSIVAGLLLLLIGYADRVDPASHPMIATLTLGYPFVIILNLIALAAWIFVKPLRAIIPVMALILAFGPVRSYCPINPITRSTDGDMKVVSFNIKSWSMWKPDSSECFIAQHLADMDADIVCLQEASTSDKNMEAIDSIMLSVYPHKDTAYYKEKGNMQILYSKYPILKHERIPYESKNNHSTAFYLNYDGDTLLVVNNHFESNCLIPADRADFDSIVSGDVNTNQAREKTRSLMSKVAAATAIRAPQAVAVGLYLDRHSNLPTIVCGDFNDGPNSYVHHQMASRLTDCYATTGFGPGTSYHESHFYFRIDHIFCSKQFEPVRTLVEKNASLSDHYPIITWLKPTAKD